MWRMATRLDNTKQRFLTLRIPESQKQFGRRGRSTFGDTRLNISVLFRYEFLMSNFLAQA